MKIFLDTANVEEIKRALEWGLCDGVTTNPTLIARERRPFRQVIQEICRLVDGPVSAEVTALDAEGMVKEAKEISSWAPNIVIKVPLIPEGVKAIHILSKEGIKCNATLIFSLNQAILAAKAGAAFCSPFVGRLDDIGHDGMNLVEQIIKAYQNYNFNTQVIVASVRHPRHVIRAALIGAHIVTLPFRVLELMFKHPLTDIGLERFLADWKAVEEGLKQKP